MTSVASRKDALRGKMRFLRDSLTIGARGAVDDRIARRAVGLFESLECDVVLSYLSFGSEIETRRIIRAMWGAGKVVALPRCEPDGRSLRWYRVTTFEGLVVNPMGIAEPVANDSSEQTTDVTRALAIVPGLTFDRAGNRLGYGGGYYDAFLSAFPGISVGLAREVQMSEDLRELGVVAAHDRRVDMVVTEERVIRAR